MQNKVFVGPGLYIINISGGAKVQVHFPPNPTLEQSTEMARIFTEILNEFGPFPGLSHTDGTDNGEISGGGG